MTRSNTAHTSRFNVLAGALLMLALEPLFPKGCAPGGPGGGGGSDAGVCSAVPTCTASDTSACPSGYSCDTSTGKCIAPYFGTIDCTCDAQCPTSQPFCHNRQCVACLSDSDCPTDQPCCAPIPETIGRTSCYPRGSFPDPSCQNAPRSQ